MKKTIVDENKMRNYINQFTVTIINNNDFNNWIKYIKEWSEYIESAKNEFDGDVCYSNLTLTVDHIDYYAYVIFTFNKDYTEVKIDLDYEHEIECDDVELMSVWRINK